MELKPIISAFLGEEDCKISPINNGLINTTLLVESPTGKYILQKINTGVFKTPDILTENHLKTNKLLQEANYRYELVDLIPAQNGNFIFFDAVGNAWRMLTYLEDTETFLKVPSPETAEEAAQCFSSFYKALNLHPAKFEDSLPGFINFEKRINDFNLALQAADAAQKEKARSEIEAVTNVIGLPEKWIKLQQEKKLPVRTIHADPKISNILFDKNGKAKAVIDLDTVMNSTILYDFGDMIRSYCNLTDEDDASLPENFDGNIYEAVKSGFLSEIKDMLSPEETENLDYAAQVVIYIQAIRFLTDFLNHNVYYSIKYEDHNLDRTRNQLHLLRNLQKYLTQKKAHN